MDSEKRVELWGRDIDKARTDTVRKYRKQLEE